jgi:predicted transcriptional regulator
LTCGPLTTEGDVQIENLHHQDENDQMEYPEFQNIINQVCTIADIGTFDNFVSVSLDDQIKDIVSDKKYARFNTLVVIENNEIIGAVITKEMNESEGLHERQIKEIMVPAGPQNMISGEASAWNYFLEEDVPNYKLIFQENKITGIVTISDMLKPPIKMAAFAIILYLENEITKYLQNLNLSEAHIEKILNKRRMSTARKRFDEKYRSEIELSFIDSLQFADKISLILKQYNFNNQRGKKKIKSEFGKIEKIRNLLAHGVDISDDQGSLIKFVNTIKLAENFIFEFQSEQS